MATLRDGMRATTRRISWLAKDKAQKLLALLALGADSIWESYRLAVKAGWLRTPNSPPDALPLVADERGLERTPFETDAQHRDRLLAAWDAWAYAGTRAFAAFALEPYGVDPDSVTVRYAADPDWDSPYGNEHWSRFSIYLTDPTPWELTEIGNTWTIGNGNTIGSTATFEEIASIRRVLRRAKAGHEVAVEMVLNPNTDVVGTFEIGDGTVLGATSVHWRLAQFLGDPHLTIGGESLVAPGHVWRVGQTIL